MVGDHLSGGTKCGNHFIIFIFTHHYQKWDQRLQDEADENLAKALCDNFLQDIPECKEIWKELQDIKKGRKDLRYDFFFKYVYIYIIIVKSREERSF